jgi:hypothetical protein
MPDTHLDDCKCLAHRFHPRPNGDPAPRRNSHKPITFLESMSGRVGFVDSSRSGGEFRCRTAVRTRSWAQRPGADQVDHSQQPEPLHPASPAHPSLPQRASTTLVRTLHLLRRHGPVPGGYDSEEGDRGRIRCSWDQHHDGVM